MMSSKPATPSSVGPDDDGVFSFSFVGAPSDFGIRLDLYRCAPDQFVPRSEAELLDMQMVSAEIDAEIEAHRKEEEERERCQE
jgi:hypothetical protein